MNWKNITIGMIQEISQLGEMDEIEKMAHQISIITNTPFEEVSKWPLEKLQSVDVGFLTKMPDSKVKYWFKFKGHKYKLVASAREMSAHHFIELQQVSTENMIENLHLILALLAYRVNWYGKRIEDDYQWKVDNFKELPLTDVYGYTLFFSQLYPRLLADTLAYLKETENQVKEMFSGGSQS